MDIENHTITETPFYRHNYEQFRELIKSSVMKDMEFDDHFLGKYTDTVFSSISRIFGGEWLEEENSFSREFMGSLVVRYDEDKALVKYYYNHYHMLSSRLVFTTSNNPVAFDVKENNRFKSNTLNDELSI